MVFEESPAGRGDSLGKVPVHQNSECRPWTVNPTFLLVVRILAKLYHECVYYLGARTRWGLLFLRPRQHKQLSEEHFFASQSCQCSGLDELTYEFHFQFFYTPSLMSIQRIRKPIIIHNLSIFCHAVTHKLFSTF